MVAACHQQRQEIDKRIQILNKYEDKIKGATESTNEEMKRQLDSLVEKLQTIYKEEMESVIRLKAKQLDKIKEDKK